MTARLALTSATQAAIGKFTPAFLDDVLRGLSAPQKVIPARWLYDRRGSELFEAITRLPEYYPTRTELAILQDNVAEMAQLIGPGHAVIEFGSGSASKTPILLSAIQPSAYVAIDISANTLHASTANLAQRFPSLAVHPIVADFMHPLQLPPLEASPRLGFFPGSTIGNLVPAAAVDLLRSMAATLGPQAWLLIGFDRLKDSSCLIPAYNDAQGVTAQFNLNLLQRINRELDGDIPLDAFCHKAIWNDADARIEMHLRAVRAVLFTVAGQTFRMESGDSIHTENSAKYGSRDMRLLLNAGGWKPVKEWQDDEQRFSVVLAQAADARAMQP